MTANPYAGQWQRLRTLAKTVYPPVCHLCRLPIDMAISGRDPMGWSLDHLDPVIQAGPGVPQVDRVRPAHLGCNSGRRDRPVVSRPRSRVW